MAQQPARAQRERRVAAADLGAEDVGLLEVVADDLVVGGEVAVAALEPVGEALV